ncbi:hypothetical protein PRZ48_008140 [Zasmidium cellare]|uniref:Uncharacterized protein n=1 Tax=Zasmidium cellare TaxID=395010 RepID=A0ABR0EEM9_ZASCE|nr:hypothetical protein PRZ48_008140 [Zasmidium cellare]
MDPEQNAKNHERKEAASGATKIYFLHSGSLYRRQVQSSCNHLLVGDWSGQASHEFLMETVSDSGSRPSKMALDALSLAQLGVAYQDSRIIAQALRYYQGAIGGLHRQLSLVKQGLRKWEHDLVWTPYLLFWCERFTIVSKQSCMSLHLLGFSSLISGSREFFQKTDRSVQQWQMEMESFACAYFYVLENALVTRRAVPSHFQTQIFRAIGSSQPDTSMLSLGFITATFDVPALLEEVDQVLERSWLTEPSQSQPDLYIDLSSRLQGTYKMLKACETRWRLSTNLDPISMVPTTHVPTYYADLDELSLQNFESAIAFVDCQTTTILLTYSSCALCICAALHALRNTADLGPVPSRDFDTLGSTHADDICKAAMFLYNQARGATVALIWRLDGIEKWVMWEKSGGANVHC